MSRVINTNMSNTAIPYLVNQGLISGTIRPIEQRLQQTKQRQTNKQTKNNNNAFIRHKAQIYDIKQIYDNTG